MNKVLAILTVAALVTGAQGAVTINIGGGDFLAQDGTPLFGFDEFFNAVDGNLFLLIGDPSGDGFQSLDAIQNNAGFLAGDDVLLGSFGAEAWNTGIDGRLGAQLSNLDAEGLGLGVGDALTLVYFEGLMAAAVDPAAPGAKPGEGEVYGFDSSLPLTDLNGTMGLTYGQNQVDMTTLPEPTTMAVLMIGGGIVAARRRRNKRA